MRALKTLAAAALLSAGAIATPAFAQEEAPPPPPQNWSFNGVFGGLDLAAAQRGFQVYSEVCSNCHSMNLLHYRDLEGIGLTDDQIKAVAATVTVPLGVDDSGNPKTGPGTPAWMRPRTTASPSTAPWPRCSHPPTTSRTRPLISAPSTS